MDALSDNPGYPFPSAAARLLKAVAPSFSEVSPEEQLDPESEATDAYLAALPEPDGVISWVRADLDILLQEVCADGYEHQALDEGNSTTELVIERNNRLKDLVYTIYDSPSSTAALIHRVGPILYRLRHVVILDCMAKTLRDCQGSDGVSCSSAEGAADTEDALNSEAGEIRILELLPGHPEDPIVCNISVALLDEEPARYEALSYTWGSRESMESVVINQEVRQVTRNLFTALKYLRRGDCPRCLWIDSLCINQSDSVEKAHQVQLMGEIYHRASEVLVWIDPRNGSGHDAIKVLARLRLDEIRSGDSRLADPHFKEALLDLLERDWWSRIWVIQEVAMARKDPRVICGQDEVSWKSLDAAFEAAFPDHNARDLRESEKRTLESREKCFGLRREAARQPGGLSAQLSDLAPQAAVATQASMKQDMIISMRALLDKFARSVIIPNYSVPCEYVFTTATILMLLEKGLAIYSYCAVQQPGPGWLPSWVPDFSSQHLSSPYFPGYKEGLELPQSQGTNAPSFRLLGPSQLVVDGFVLDEVETSYTFEAANFHRVEYASRNFSFCSQLVDFELLAFEGSEKEVGASNPCYPFQALRRQGRFYDLVNPLDTDEDSFERFNNFLNHFKRRRGPGQGYDDMLNGRYKPPTFCSGRRFFLTRSGFAGVGVPSLQPGDLVVTIFGLPLPFVIRRCAGFYNFVGATWIKGVKHDSLALYSNIGGLEKSTFTIR